MHITTILNENAEIMERFPHELSPLIMEVQNKTRDLDFIKNLMTNYISILDQLGKNNLQLLDFFEEMKELQVQINPENFNFEE